MITPDDIQLLSDSEYMIYYYIGIGLGIGGPAGYTFACKTTLKGQTEMIKFYRTELNSVKARVKELEQQLFPRIIDRRHHRRDSDEDEMSN